jgi:hypothetical protein
MRDTNPLNMNIREYYLETYPTDELGVEINSTATFGNLWAAIRGGFLYEYIGVFDSVIRERIFERFSEITGHDYDYIYEEWLNA